MQARCRATSSLGFGQTNAYFRSVYLTTEIKEASSRSIDHLNIIDSDSNSSPEDQETSC